MAPTNHERAIKAYLLYLEDPEQVIDRHQVAAAERAVAAATNPVEKVLALSQLERARKPDVDMLRAGFVAHAATWAQRHGATARAFAEAGVPADVLKDAGLDLNATPPPAVPSRRTVSNETLLRTVPRGKDFRVSEYAALGNVTMSRARDQLAQLVRADRVRVVGPDPTWPGPGQPPLLYRATNVGGEGGI